MADSNRKFNLTELLNQRSKEIAPQGQREAEEEKGGRTETADIYDLLPSTDNFYSTTDVEDLKQSIELLGVLQPLLVTDEEDGKRRIIAGHRRRLAVMQLVDEGKERFRYVPIVTKPKKPMTGTYESKATLLRWNEPMKRVLSEVLNDLRMEGKCYVKYERKQGCFHLTCR